MSDASPFRVYLLRNPAVQAGTLKLGKKPLGKAGPFAPARRIMAEFIIKLADERGRVQEQIQTAATAEELRARFIHAGYHVFSVRARGGIGR